MPEQFKPTTLTRNHSKNLRDDAARRLSRSPHPYHRQQYELPYSSEKFNTSVPSLRSPLRPSQNTDDEDQDGRWNSEVYKETYKTSTGSDSGTEADDEHFLKGLPAPKIRPHKGLRGFDASLSGTPSPILSPVILEDDIPKSRGFQRQKEVIPALADEAARKLLEKVRWKRKVEVIRRCCETSILFFLATLLCFDPQIRKLLHLWRRGEFERL